MLTVHRPGTQHVDEERLLTGTKTLTIAIALNRKLACKIERMIEKKSTVISRLDTVDKYILHLRNSENVITFTLSAYIIFCNNFFECYDCTFQS